MNRKERRKQQKLNHKSKIIAPENVSNYTLRQISETTGVKIESLMIWKNAREKEMMELFQKESQEKLYKAEDHIAVANVLISLYAINITWGFKKANQRFVENLNVAKEYLEKVGIEKAYQQIHKEMGINLEFNSIDINKEFGFGKDDKNE